VVVWHRAPANVRDTGGELEEVLVVEPEPHEQQVTGQHQTLNNAVERFVVLALLLVVLLGEHEGTWLSEVTVELQQPGNARIGELSGEHAVVPVALEAGVECPLEAAVEVGGDHLPHLQTGQQRMPNGMLGVLATKEPGHGLVVRRSKC
jgi:hypothetical protein